MIIKTESVPTRLVSLFCGTALFLAVSCEKQSTAREPLLGRDPVITVAETNGGVEALLDWAQKGFRNMTVIHAGVHSGMQRIPEARLKQLSVLVREKRWEAFRGPASRENGGLVSGSDYLSAAAGLGIVSRICWVIPYPFFESAGGGEKARQFLADSGLIANREEADRFSLSGACLAGSIGKAEIDVCAPDTAHLIREPVLLVLDGGFFPVYAQSRGIHVLESFKLFMDEMFSRKYAVAAAYITTSSGEEPFDPALLYLGSQVDEALRDPSIMRKAEPPPIWKARDEGDALLRAREFRRAYGVLTRSIKEYGPDKGLRSLLACAALQQGSYSAALDEAGSLCREDRLACGLLLYLGDVAADKGKQERALDFYRQALETVPGWKTAERRLAEAANPGGSGKGTLHTP